jgi:hypothetical protein
MGLRLRVGWGGGGGAVAAAGTPKEGFADGAAKGNEGSFALAKVARKMTLSLRADGYTNLVSHESSSPTKGLKAIKTWGWDLETSDIDEQQYILSSRSTLKYPSRQAGLIASTFRLGKSKIVTASFH